MAIFVSTMKALIQRVSQASVHVDGNKIAHIDQGVLAYIGIAKDDTPENGKKLIDKICHYRLFDKDGKMHQSVMDIKGDLLIVSQFTLMANTKNGRRPDFSQAMRPALAKDLFDKLITYAKNVHSTVQTGQFGADMQVIAANDGPINFLLEC